MGSGVQFVLKEGLIWLVVFALALGAFFFLDTRIAAFLMADGSDKSTAPAPRFEEKPLFRSPSQKTRQDRPRQQSDGYGRVVLHAERSGHFRVTTYINGSDVEMLADTGATYIALTWEDAETLGITADLEFTGRTRTANGIARVAPVILETVSVGDIEVEHVKAVVMEEGKLNMSLLGMSFIGRLERFEMSGRDLVLIQ